MGKCGRKEKTTSSARTDRVLLNAVKTNRRTSFTEIISKYNKSTLYKLSKRTVQRLLHFMDILEVW